MNTSTLERATITVQRIIPAKAQGKSATIKDVDGMMFGIWPDKLGIFREGETYDIEFTATVKNGTTYRDIKSGRMVQQQVQRAQAAERKSDPFVTSTEMRQARSLGAAATPPEQPRQQQNGNGNYYRPTAPRDAERMFVCSTLNAFIQTGRVDATGQTLVDYVNTLREVWQATFGQDDQA